MTLHVFQTYDKDEFDRKYEELVSILEAGGDVISVICVPWQKGEVPNYVIEYEVA